MPSAWVEHIRDFAKRNNLTYGCALSDPKCSEEYRIKFPKPAKKGKKVKKLDLSKTEFVPLEEAEMDTEPKTKMVVEKKPVVVTKKVNEVKKAYDAVQELRKLLKITKNPIFTEPKSDEELIRSAYDYFTNTKKMEYAIQGNIKAKVYYKQLKDYIDKTTPPAPPAPVMESAKPTAAEVEQAFPDLAQDISVKEPSKKTKRTRPLTEWRLTQREEKKNLNLKDKWKVGDEVLYTGSLYIVRKVTPKRLFIQADIPFIETSKKDGENIIETGKYPREFKGRETSMGNNTGIYYHGKLPKNYNYKYKSTVFPPVTQQVTKKGKGIQLNRDMVMKMVGEGLSC